MNVLLMIAGLAMAAGGFIGSQKMKPPHDVLIALLAPGGVALFAVGALLTASPHFFSP